VTYALLAWLLKVGELKLVYAAAKDALKRLTVLWR